MQGVRGHHGGHSWLAESGREPSLPPRQVASQGTPEQQADEAHGNLRLFLISRTWPCFLKKLP